MGRIREYFEIRRGAGAIPELDGLRGIAILLVLGRHSSRLFEGQGMVLPIGGWDASIPFLNGWAGVDLFFVLSGFLITYHILHRWSFPARWSDVRTYFVKRALRILPAYYATLIIVAIGTFPFYSMSYEDLGIRVAYHLAFLQDYFPSDIVVAFWSLGVEEKFYMAIPFLMWGLARVGVPLRLVVLVAIGFLSVGLRLATYAAHPEVDTYDEYFRVLRSPFHLSLDCLMAGSVCAVLHAHRADLPWLDRPWVTRLLFFGGAGVSGFLLGRRVLLDSVGLFNVGFLYPLLALGFGAVLLSLLSGRAPGAAFFRARWLLFFSRISYSLYLVHLIFLTLTFETLRHFIGLDEIQLGLRFVLYSLCFTLVSTLAALALHYAVEKPFLDVKDRL